MEIMQTIPQSPPSALAGAGLMTSDKTDHVPVRTPSGSSAFAALLRAMASSSPLGMAMEEVPGKSGMQAAVQEEAAVASSPGKKESETEESPSSAADGLPLPMMVAVNGMPMAVASILPTQMQPQDMAARTEPVETTAVAERLNPAAKVVQQQGVFVKTDGAMVLSEGVVSAAKPTQLTQQASMANRDASSADILLQQSNPVPATEQLVSVAQPAMVVQKLPQLTDNHELPDTVHPSAKPDVIPAITPKVENVAAAPGEPVVIDAKPLPQSSSHPAFPETVQFVAKAPETTSPQQVNVNAAGQTAPSQPLLTATPAQPTATPAQPTAASALQGSGNNAGEIQMPVITELSATKQPETKQQQSPAQPPADPVVIAKAVQEKAVQKVHYEANQHLHTAAEPPVAKSADPIATALDPAKVEVVFQEPSSRKEFFEGENSGRSGMNEKMPGALHNGAVTDLSKNFSVPELQPKTEGTKTALSESILAQIKDGVAAHDARGHNQITISLKPAELGELKINVSMVDQRLKVEVVAENRMVKDVLMSNLDNLKESLLKQNLTMDKFDVQTGVGHGFNQSSGDEKWVPRNQSHKNFTSVVGPIDEGAEQRVGYLTTGNNSLVDVRF